MRNKLGSILFGQTRGAILALLYGHPDESFYVRQIARELDTSVGTVQRELEKLSGAELTVRSRAGSQVFYRANRESPVYAEVRSLVAKSVGMFQVLRSALDPLAGRIRIAFVYGSVARQEETAASDIDVLIVGSVSFDEAVKRLGAVESKLRRNVNPTVYSVAEYQSKLASQNHFLTAVLQGEKVFLVGDENELGKVGGVRLAAKGAHELAGDRGAAQHRRARSSRLAS